MALTAEQQAQIDALKKQYATAQAKKDTAGMASANQQANAIRNSAGMVAGVDYNPTTGGALLPQRTITSVPLGQGVAPNSGYITQNGQLTTRQAGDFVANSPVSASNVKQTVPATTTPTTTPTTTTTTGGGTTTTTTSPTNEYISKIYEAQQKANVQKFYDARNAAAAQNQQQARNFAEFMAARGMTGSGANAQAEISRQGVYQANLTNLANQEIQSANDIAAQEAKARQDQYNTDRNFALQEANLTGMYNGQLTSEGIINKAKADNANALAKAELEKIQISNDIERAKLNASSDTTALEYAKLKAAVDKGEIDAKIAQEKLTQLQGIDKQIKNATLDQKNSATNLNNKKASNVGKQTPKQKTYNPSAEVKTITDLYTKTNPDTKTVTVSNKAGAAVYILGLQKTYGLTNQQVDALAKRFGLKDKDFTNAVK